MTLSTEPVDHSNAPPPPPRPMADGAFRRSWTEPGVRVWWLIASAILALIVVYAASQLYAWHDQNQLIEHGDLVQATIIEGISASAHLTMQGQNVEPDSVVTLEFIPKGKTGNPVQVTGQLDGRTERIRVRETVKIRVDPKDPKNWTYRSEPVPLATTLFVELAMFPLIPILLGIAFFKNKQLIQTWKTGEAVLAIVTDCRQTPIAPMSYQIRCGLTDGRDKRLRTVYVPRSKKRLTKGDKLWVVVPRDKKGSALAAAWMES